MEERNCGNEDTEIKYIWHEAERGNTGENATKQESVSWVTSILESGGVDRKVLEEMVSKRMEKTWESQNSCRTHLTPFHMCSWETLLANLKTEQHPPRDKGHLWKHCSGHQSHSAVLSTSPPGGQKGRKACLHDGSAALEGSASKSKKNKTQTRWRITKITVLD